MTAAAIVPASGVGSRCGGQHRWRDDAGTIPCGREVFRAACVGFAHLSMKGDGIVFAMVRLGGHPMRNHVYRATIVAAATLILAGCATLRVSTHVDRGLVWSKYKTFDWGTADALPAGDPRLDKDPYFQDRVAGAIEKAMAARGFEMSPKSERPDLLIHYHASIAERLDDEQIRYEAGTLVVDVVDAATNVLIWRGWAQGSVEGVLGNRERMRRRIDEGVARMFQALPERP
jgi:hypothetical protein